MEGQKTVLSNLEENEMKGKFTHVNLLLYNSRNSLDGFFLIKGCEFQ